MKRYITVDSGTTNTRISLVVNGEIAETLSFHIGATKSIDNKTALSDTLKRGIEQLLRSHSLSENDITCVICCGMISSEFGLVTLDHITAPADIGKMQNAVYRCTLEHITGIPFAFIRGVKTGFSTIEEADVMRGEETEIVGVFEGSGIYILPGSHSKIITVDSNCTIQKFKTMLTGEMISAIAQGTILKDAITLHGCEIDKVSLIEGYIYTRDHGISEALFKIRLLKNFFHYKEEALYSFYIGSILESEIRFILSAQEKQIYIGGQKAMRYAIAVLLREFSDKEIRVLSDSCVEHSMVYGMLKIYEGIK